MEVEEPQQGPAPGWKWADATPPPPATALPDVSKRAGVPAAGRGTQLDPEKSQRAAAAVYDTATTPLAHPTGIDMIDGLTSPAGLASLALSGAGLARETAAGVGGIGKAMAAARYAIADIATPYAKYEAAKAALELAHVPSIIASPLAYAISGYRKNGKVAPAEAPSDVSPPGVDRYLPSKSGYQAEVTPASAAPASPVASAPAAATVPASPIPSTAAQSPTGAAPPSAPSPQQVLNEAALARRRAEYQARQAAAPPSEAPAPAKAKLFASEGPEYMRLIKAGKTHRQAMDVIEANRLLQERLGLSTPTAEETRFPKGNRGKVPE